MPVDGSANELCVTAGVLSSVAGSPHAAHKLLSAYSGRLRSAQQRLLKPQNAGEQCGVLCIPASDQEADPMFR